MTERNYNRALMTLAVVSVYCWAAICVHAFRHPGLTTTQRLFNIWEALTWQ